MYVLDMWLLIHAWIKVYLCQYKEHDVIRHGEQEATNNNLQFGGIPYC